MLFLNEFLNKSIDVLYLSQNSVKVSMDQEIRVECFLFFILKILDFSKPLKLRISLTVFSSMLNKPEVGIGHVYAGRRDADFRRRNGD
jgi:hypothetical protein